MIKILKRSMVIESIRKQSKEIKITQDFFEHSRAEPPASQLAR